MAAPMISPAGYEDSDDEEFDEDGFHIGKRQKQMPTEFKQHVSNGSHGRVAGFSNLSKNRNSNASTTDTHYKSESVKSSKTKSRSAPPIQNGNQKLTVEDLHGAITRQQTDIVREYLEQGLNVEEVLKGGWTCLMYAANNSNSEVVRMLLEHGADAKFHKDLYTVLMAACSSRENEDSVLECVQLLLDSGADVNSHDRYHMSPLMYAAREGKSTVIDYLVKSGAKVDKQDTRGWTALTWSSSRGHKKSVQVLLGHDADPFKKHIDRQTAVDIAYTYGHKAIGLLLEGKTVDEEREENTTISTPTVSSVNTSPSNTFKKRIATLEIETKPTDNTEAPLEYKKHDELDLFLMGLELEHLIPIVREHQVDFASFLRASEKDLIDMGITQIGVRKKIIDALMAVHKKDWETSSLPAMTMINKQIKCSDAVAMCVNISKHVRYTASHISFLKDQLSMYPHILEDSDYKGGKGSVELMTSVTDLTQNVSILKKELDTLQKILNKARNNVDVPDLIDVAKKQKPSHKWKYLKTTVFVAVIGVLIIKRHELFSAITSLAHTFPINKT